MPCFNAGMTLFSSKIRYGFYSFARLAFLWFGTFTKRQALLLETTCAFNHRLVFKIIHC
jgi:hypothetical protein